MLFLDRKNPRALDLAAAFEKANLPSDLCLVFGGDGTMLEAIRSARTQGGACRRFLGLNCGRVGFLMNDVESSEKAVERVIGGHYDLFSFPRLRLVAQATDSSGTSHGPLEKLAVNDVYVERMTGQSCHLRLSIDGNLVVDRLVCDGLVISTAIGSTGYGLAAGGPACHPRIRVMQVTPICPHRPRLVPLIVPAEASIEVQPLDTHRRPVRAVADGVDVPRVSRLQVRDAGEDVEIGFFTGHDFTGTMFRKVLLF